MNRQLVITVIVCLSLLALPVGFAFGTNQVFVDDKPYSVGEVSILTSATDPFNMQILSGVYQVSREKNIDVTVYMAASDDDEIEKFLLASQRHELIVLSGGQNNEDLKQIAENNPQSQYLGVDLVISGDELPQNIANIVFRSDEPSFVAGYVAGMMTQTGSVGILLGVEDSPILENFASAFQKGLNSAESERNLEIALVRKYVGSYNDSIMGYKLTEEMYLKENCDIAFMVAGSSGNGGILAAQDYDRYVIGVDQDQNYLAPDNVIFSVVKKIDSVLKSKIIEYSAGVTYGGTEISAGYAEDSVGVVHFLNCVPESVQQRAKDFEYDIKTGRLTV